MRLPTLGGVGNLPATYLWVKDPLPCLVTLLTEPTCLDIVPLTHILLPLSRCRCLIQWFSVSLLGVLEDNFSWARKPE